MRLVAAAMLLSCCSSRGADSLQVAAAANLSVAVKEIALRYQQSTGVELFTTVASTGQLCHQIENGAPIDLFLAADTEHIDILERAGRIVPDSKAIYARGRLTLWSPKEEPVTQLAELKRVKRIAIANPKHAPYGIAARRKLEATALWEELHPKLVIGENVRQALQFAEAGNADAALIPRSLAIHTDGQWTDLDVGLDQALAIVRPSAAATQLRAFLLEGEGRTILARHGYDPP